MLPAPFHHIRNLSFLNKRSITTVLMGRILLPPVKRTRRVVAPAIVRVASKLRPAFVQFRVPSRRMQAFISMMSVLYLYRAIKSRTNRLNIGMLSRPGTYR